MYHAGNEPLAQGVWYTVADVHLDPSEKLLRDLTLAPSSGREEVAHDF